MIILLNELYNQANTAAKEIIETRLVGNNITDYEVYTDANNHQIIVRFPWAADESDFDAQKAVQELGETALLTFHLADAHTQGKILSEPLPEEEP